MAMAWNKSWGRLAAVALAVSACGGPQRPPRDALEAARASRALADLADEFWQASLRHRPVWATSIGERDRDDALDDPGAEERARHASTLRNLQERARLLEQSRADDLDERERVTLDLLRFELDTDLDVSVACATETWAVDQLAGPQVTLPELPTFHTVTTPAQGEALLTRYGQIDAHFAAHIDNLRAGLAAGRVAPRVNIERVMRQLDEMLATPPVQSAFVSGVFTGDAPSAAALGPGFRARLEAIVAADVYGGLKAYRDFLKAELMPRARDRVGVDALPGGADCYRARIRRETGLARSPDEVHALGLSEVARLEAEMQRVVSASGGGALRDALARLAAAPGLTSADALLAHNRALVARALAALPRAFGRLPKTVIELRPIEAFREKDAPAGYYYSAPRDGSRPAYYVVNTYAPRSRLVYKLPALAFHEAVPGHHLQIALANENTALPAFQRELGQTALIEGWALYAESLADELGLYQNADEKLGQLSYAMWRAVRLVVDTGLHAQGWGRQQAVDYLVEKTGHDRGEAENEVDRYIIWPGQALAYALGALELSALRADAQTRLGAHFDLRAFHDVVLEQGAIPLPTLRRRVGRWIQAGGPAVE